VRGPPCCCCCCWWWAEVKWGDAARDPGRPCSTDHRPAARPPGTYPSNHHVPCIGNFYRRKTQQAIPCFLVPWELPLIGHKLVFLSGEICVPIFGKDLTATYYHREQAFAFVVRARELRDRCKRCCHHDSLPVKAEAFAATYGNFEFGVLDSRVATRKW
jgi:hypothetical protein